MPVKQTYSQSDMEKRLKLLNMQLYGKKVQGSGLLVHSEIKTTNTISDLTYLKQDLSKIALLASLAIGAELILYFFERG